MMRAPQSRLVAAVLGAALLLAGCSSSPTVEFINPAVVEDVPDGAIPSITLTEDAVTRLAIETVTVAAAGDGFVVPSAAVLITTDGNYWVYTNPEPRVYRRHEIKPVVEENLQAFFADGPEVGTSVVVAGVPELYGTEYGIGK